MNAPNHALSKRTGRLLAIVVALGLVAAACSSSGESETTTTEASGNTPDTTEVAEPLEAISLYSPAATLAFSAPFSLIGDDGPLSKVANEITTDSWTTPDVLRSLLVGGDSDVTAVPTNVGANLYNKGVDVKLAAVLVWGLLHVIGPEGTSGSWDDLRGQTVMVPFQNDMPDLVFRFLAQANDLEPGKDFKIEYYAQPPEIVARLIGGLGKWAVLPEHVATIALGKANENGQKLGRAFDLQSEWGKQTGSDRIPQAGVVVSPEIAARPDVVAALLEELGDKVELINTLDETALSTLSTTFELPAETLKSIIPRLNLEVVSGAEAKDELERFYNELAKLNADLIGGKVPDDDFYLSVG